MLVSVLRFLFLIALLLSSVISVAQEKAARVVVEKVTVQTSADTTPVIARLTATVESEIATRREGIVKSVNFRIGDQVVLGQELARLDDQLATIQLRNATASMNSAKAGVTVAEARMVQAKQTLERQSGLQGSAAFAKGRFEDLQQEAAQAQGELSRTLAQLAVAEAAITRAQYDVTHSVISAPLDGIITARSAQPGQFVSRGGTVATVLDIGGLEIEADVPADLIGNLTIGREVEALMQNGLRLTAMVRSVLPVETVSTRTRPVRLTIDLDKVEPYLLADGNTVTVNVPVSRAQKIVVVPKDALVQSLNGGWQVFVARDQKSVRVPVSLGNASGDGYEVLNGLTVGDLVVVRGNERLQPGQAINPVFGDDTTVESEPKS